jgi:Putative transposase
LEHLCRYLLRPPLARERLTESAHGQLLFELAHQRADGTTHLLLEPLELVEKIALLIPPPRFQTLRFHGVLGPRAAGRSAVIPRRHDAVDEGPAAGRSEGTGPRAEPSPGSLGLPSESSRWAALPRRLFALDVFQCPRGGGRRRIVGVHTGGERRRVLLERLGFGIASPSAEPSRPPPRRGA